MKRLLMILVLAVLVLLPVEFVIGASVYPMFGMGVLMEQGGTSESGTWVGQEAPLYRDTTTGLMLVQRAGYFYLDSEDDVQALSSALMAKKTLGLWNGGGLYAGMGGNYTYDMREGDDNGIASLKFEFGVDIYRKLGVAVGVDFIPVNEGTDKHYLYMMIDLTPKLLE